MTELEQLDVFESRERICAEGAPLDELAEARERPYIYARYDGATVRSDGIDAFWSYLGKKYDEA